jgi:hypothetical protein
VAPNDPRSGRREALFAAGAEEVVLGAKELLHVLWRRVGNQHHARPSVEVGA